MTEPQDVSVPPPPVEYGSFSNRLIATTLDLGLLFMLALPLVDLTMAHLFPPIDANKIVKVLNAPELRNNPPALISAFIKVLREQNAIQRIVFENLMQIVFIGLYTLPFWFRFSATPGKILFRLEIQDEKTRQPLSRRQAVIRFLGYIVSAIPMSLGFAWILFNRKRRGFHDLIAGTVVVVRPKSTDY